MKTYLFLAGISVCIAACFLSCGNMLAGSMATFATLILVIKNEAEEESK